MDSDPNLPNPPVGSSSPIQHMSQQEAIAYQEAHPQQNEPSKENETLSTGNLPSPIQITENTKYSEKNDPPLVAISVTNPVTYLKLFVNKVLKNEGIDIRLKIKPLTAIVMGLGLAISFGTGYGSGLNAAAGILFPRSSPILHRAVIYQGTMQKNGSGQYLLTLPDNSIWTLQIKTTISPYSLNNLVNQEVLVKGNLTKEPNVVEVREISNFNTNP